LADERLRLLVDSHGLYLRALTHLLGAFDASEASGDR